MMNPPPAWTRVVCAVVDKLILDLSKRLLLTSVVVTHNMESVFGSRTGWPCCMKDGSWRWGRLSRSGSRRIRLCSSLSRGEIEGPINIMNDTPLGQAGAVIP